MTRAKLIKLLMTAGEKWSGYNAPRLGAALSYYMLLSMAPLLVLIVYICGLVFSESTAEHQLLEQVRAVAGTSGANTVRMLLDNAHHASGGLATLVAVVTLLFGASGVFVELRDSLNRIWEVPAKKASLWKDMLTERLVSFGMVLAIGFLLLASLMISAALSFIEKFFSGVIPLHFAILGEFTSFFISLAGMTTLFALIFKFVPNVRAAWTDVCFGAVVTGIFFALGKTLLGLYLGTAGVGSTYGAAGSLIALIVWVYYSAQIFFFGAIFTKVYADARRAERNKQQAISLSSTATA